MGGTLASKFFIQTTLSERHKETDKLTLSNNGMATYRRFALCDVLHTLTVNRLTPPAGASVADLVAHGGLEQAKRTRLYELSYQLSAASSVTIGDV